MERGLDGVGRRALASALASALFVAPVAGATGAVATTEAIVEIRIHGNYSMPDEEVIRLADVAVGDPAESWVLDAIAHRLSESGRFETVEVQKRYRSLTARDEVAVVIAVREKPRSWLADRLMFAPILGYEEGYGFAYGMQFGVVDAPWRGGQFSVPMTWGGDRRTALEMESSFGNGSQGRLRGGASASRRMHPHFEIEDERLRLWGGLHGRLTSGLRVDVEAGREEVVFGDSSDWLTRVLVGVEYRSTWSEFPRDDVKLRAALERLTVDGQGAAVFRPRVDAQAFKGAGGQAVLAARVLYNGASAGLPLYERSLLGGAGTLRGWKAGVQVGDRMLATSVELRVPLSSALAADKTGFRIFYDAAAVWNSGSTRGRLLEGVGVGVFVAIPLVGSVLVDVGHDLRGGVVVHGTGGFGF